MSDDARDTDIVDVPKCKCKLGFMFPISSCRHMLQLKGDMDMQREHYRCAECGHHESLDYEEMR